MTDSVESTISRSTGLAPEESSGRGLLVTSPATPVERVSFDADGAAMLPEESSGAGVQGTNCPHETPAISGSLLPAHELPEGGVGLPPDEWRIAEANRRREVLGTYNELLAQGKTKAEAVKVIGIGYSTVWRWLKAFEQNGFSGLLPQTDKCGRKTAFEQIGMTEDEVKTLLQSAQGINLDTESVTGALRLFAHSDRCPSRLAQIILDPNKSSKHAIPPSLRDLARVSKPAQDAHRGHRRLSLKGIYVPRRMDVIPGDVFTADDTTPIWAWYVPWRESEEYPFGVKLLQGQFIPIMDVASQCIVTYVMIAREKGSYRAADIWHLFGHTFDTVGLPRLGFQLERGSWEANLIRGQEISYSDDEVSYSRRVGGLRQLPTNPHDQVPEGFVWPKQLQTFTSYLPKSKSIEAFFNRSQSLEGTLWGALGRDQMRRPFEKAKKQFQVCQRGAADPRLHFLSHIELATRLNQMLSYLNNEPMEGEVFHGIPQMKFAQSVAERPLFTFSGSRELEELRWLYRRDWAVVQITQGWARVRLTHEVSGERYSLFYCNPDVFARNEGQQVAVYYDRENFQSPAQIVLAKTGEFLCEAQYQDRVGTFLGTDRSGLDVAKAWRQAVLSTYGTLVQHAPSRQLPSEIAARRADAAVPIAQATTTTTDHRPAAVPQPMRNIFAAPSKEDFDKRRERLAASARAAQELRSLAGEE
jgi:transposase